MALYGHSFCPWFWFDVTAVDDISLNAVQFHGPTLQVLFSQGCYTIILFLHVLSVLLLLHTLLHHQFRVLVFSKYWHVTNDTYMFCVSYHINIQS